MNAHVENTLFNDRNAALLDHPADADHLKAALRTLGGGVSIITAGEGEARTGATVTSATALSVEPARMLVSLNRSSSTWPVVERYGHLGINIVGADHETLADQFAGRGGLRGPDRYRGGEWTTAVSGAPLLVDAVAAIDCVVEEAIERHSHVIVIGRVVAIRIGTGHSLLYQNGRYHDVAAR
ncbi:flavin reductase family protein [Shinella curvata]|uniref:Flavin reductase family protein n=1 Tax=Shinella curvata TaxID=1817964 RepID=A0ABT8XBF3_9HYPH|nr:flavin reductase family protein [Shinella curvata]MCJ8055013.1 flavin reductase family protein [Shinella curvata]MDO6120591.1 flavin reductase family protein [Shinella curvata]